MLRLTLAGDDAVLICATVAEADFVVRGSTRGHYCEECDAELWRAPGAPLAELKRGGELRRASAFGPSVTVLLCVDCARAHGASI